MCEWLPTPEWEWSNLAAFPELPFIPPLAPKDKCEPWPLISPMLWLWAPILDISDSVWVWEAELTVCQPSWPELFLPINSFVLLEM